MTIRNQGILPNTGDLECAMDPGGPEGVTSDQDQNSNSACPQLIPRQSNAQGEICTDNVMANGGKQQ